MISKLILIAETTLLLSVAALYIIHCPFNKVEESFNTQAVHDFVNIFPYQLPISTTDNNNGTNREIAIRNLLHWDHMQFPGVVPRTFIGAALIGAVVKSLKFLISNGIILENLVEEGESDLTFQFVLQLLARFTLASGVAISLTCVTRALQNRYGLGFRLCFLVNIISQFHYLFYAGRFLPNTYAAIFTNLVLASWIKRQYSKSVMYIAFSVVIFRFDTALFFGCLLLDAVFIKRTISLGRVLAIGIPFGLVALTLTFIVDSIFWARPVWPEFEGLYFNVWLNKSHEWGTQPFFYYIYSSIPRILMASAPLLFLAEHRVTRDYLMPTLAFVLLYSILPHKELRFILLISPFLNICATSGLMNVHYYLNQIFLSIKPQTILSPKVRGRLASFIFMLAVLGLITANLFGSTILARVANHNYPGGNAILSLGVRDDINKESRRAILAYNDSTIGRQDGSRVAVYVNNLAAQTGGSRFIQVNGIYYSKSPKLDHTTFRKRYEQIFLILEPKEVDNFMSQDCAAGRYKRVDDWARRRNALECELPNQGAMSCNIEEGITGLWKVDMSGLMDRVRKLLKPQLIWNIDDQTFIKTKPALYIIKCER